MTNVYVIEASLRLEIVLQAASRCVMSFDDGKRINMHTLASQAIPSSSSQHRAIQHSDRVEF